MASTKKWADTPFTLLSTPRASLNGAPESPASKNVSEMALMHNVLLRGLNSIYLQAPSISPTNTADVADFMTFISAWSSILHSHHAAEENVYFPMLEEMCDSKRKGILKRNHEEHEAFLPGLFRLDVYVAGVKDNGKGYEGERVRELIDGFGRELERHLKNEIGALQELGEDEGIDWVGLGKAMAAYSKKSADRVKEVPFIITNSDVTYEDGIHGPRFPPFPWLVGQIFRWVYIPQLKGAWRFSSCDDYGVPKELPFVAGDV